MSRSRFLSVALLLACLVPTLASAAETERFHKVVPMGPGGTLKLHSFSGVVRVTGADVAQVTVDATRRAERDRLDHIKLDVEVAGSVVSINANKKDPGWEHENDNVVETDFEIQVPRETTLELDVFSAGVRVSGVTGPQTLHTFSGRIEVQDAPARLKAKTFSGAVDLRFGGDVSEPDLDVDTFSGRIDLRMTDAMRGKLEFRTRSGDLRSDLPITLQRQSRRTLVGELGAGGQGRVQLRSFSGDVTISR